MSAQTQPIKLAASAAMLDMIQGFWVSRAICVAAEFDIPGLMKEGPKASDKLALAVGGLQLSVSRYACPGSVGVFTEDNRQGFALTPLRDSCQAMSLAHGLGHAGDDGRA